MEIAMEDDVFFADLSKQISLLIMDDEEDLINHSPSVSFEAFSQPFHQAPRMQFHQQQEQPIYRRECKGTGVFIPRSSHPRRKNKQERCNPKFNKQFNYSRGFSSHIPHNSKPASYNDNDSFNPRRID